MRFVVVVSSGQNTRNIERFCQEFKIEVTLEVLGSPGAVKAIRDAQGHFDGRGKGTPMVVGDFGESAVWAASDPTSRQLAHALNILRMNR